jgi:uncharacterized protein
MWARWSGPRQDLCVADLVDIRDVIGRTLDKFKAGARTIKSDWTGSVGSADTAAECRRHLTYPRSHQPGKVREQAMNPPIVDFHAHAFPDSLAARAVGQLQHEGNVKAVLDGRIASLLASMDASGIETSVICSIATKPEQFDPILKWSLQIASPRIIPFASIHPKGPDPIGKAHRVAEAGLVGVKLHPYYQDFELDDETLYPFYRALEELGLLVVCHTGFDFAFPRDRKGDPMRIVRLLDRVPGLRFVATHVGAWDDWDEVERYFIGKPIATDLSLSLEFLGRARGREMLLAHPADYILFGTDSPWGGQAETLRLVRDLELGDEREQRLLWQNARRLLAKPGSNSPSLAAG